MEGTCVSGLKVAFYSSGSCSMQNLDTLVAVPLVKNNFAKLIREYFKLSIESCEVDVWDAYTILEDGSPI